MKKSLILCAALTLVLLGACGNNTIPDAPSATPASTQTPEATPAPNFSGADFSGHWYVHGVIDSNGTPLSDGEKEELGAGFTLELLSGGAYFVYDEGGIVLGQGDYAVAQDRLTLTAGDTETVYEIVGGDTLRITQPDGSVTVMKRITETCADADSESPDEDTGDAGAQSE